MKNLKNHITVYRNVSAIFVPDYISVSTSSFFDGNDFLGEKLCKRTFNELWNKKALETIRKMKLFFLNVNQKNLCLPFQGSDHQGVKIVPPYSVVMNRKSIHSFHSTPTKLYPRLVFVTIVSYFYAASTSLTLSLTSFYVCAR